MSGFILKSLFSALSKHNDAPIPHAGNIALNYVWINKEPHDYDVDEVLCGVPLQNIDRVITNAKRYPEAAVTLWLDYDLLDDASIHMVASHIYIQDAHNIKIRDLREIPSFQENTFLFDWERSGLSRSGIEGFSEDDTHNIWGRVDLARLLAVRHTLDEGASYALYSDFDNEDVSSNATPMLERLRHHNMVFGVTKTGGKYDIFENSYFAFGQQRSDERYLDRLIDATVEDVRKGMNGYGAYYMAIGDYARKYGIEDEMDDLGFAAVSHPMGYRIPQPALYVEEQINLPHDYNLEGL